MSGTKPSGDVYTLWGGALSLFSGKVRSYLIKKGIRYREFTSAHPDFLERVRPIVRLSVAPILETPEGEVLQDSTEIIDALERRITTNPMIPSSPVQHTVAWLLDAYGTEHLMLPAMHYRWGEPHRSKQKLFLDSEFGRVSSLGADRDVRNASGARLIAHYSGMLTGLGGSPETSPAIEAVYLELLELLDLHFQRVPYLLGGRPTIADFGMMGPLYAHLGRDPVPAWIMATRAPNVARWVERMNLAVIEDGEFPDMAPALPLDDRLPPTLEPILQMLFRDWTSELQANAAKYNDWIACDANGPRGRIISLDGKRRVHPTLGIIEYPLRGATIRRHSAPQTLWHFDKARALLGALTGESRTRFDALMERVGGVQAMSLQLARPIERQDYVLTVG